MVDAGMRQNIIKGGGKMKRGMLVLGLLALVIAVSGGPFHQKGRLLT
jgi:hypothetical protein